MNDLFNSVTFARYPIDQVSPDTHHHVIQMTAATAGDGAAHLDKFFEEVEPVKQELKELEGLHLNLSNSHEKSKTLHNAKNIKDIRSRMENDVTTALKKAKQIKFRLEALDRSNATNRNLPGCGLGSSSDRTRTSVVNGLRNKLKNSMNGFNSLREKISSEYRQTVRRRYYTVTGENPDEKIVDVLISTGESDTFLQKAIEQQGRASILDTINEIRERHDAVKDIEKNLMELHQVFLDMSVLVQAQGEQLNNIESNLERADSFVNRGVQQLQTAKRHHKNTGKWTCYGIILLLIIILVIFLPIVLRK